jgi:hypothetical protein
MKIPVQRFDEQDLVKDQSAGTRIVVGRDDRTRGGAPHPSRGPRPASGGRSPKRFSGRAGREGSLQPPAAPRNVPRPASPKDGPVKPPERTRHHAPRPAEAGRDKPRQKPGVRPKKAEPVSKRLEYYKEKYGEDFVAPGAPKDSSPAGKAQGRRPERRGESGTKPAPQVARPSESNGPKKPSKKKSMLGGFLSLFRRKDTSDSGS